MVSLAVLLALRPEAGNVAAASSTTATTVANNIIVLNTLSPEL
jgi:hypothetical protein